MSDTTRSAALYERARQLMPAGVNSPVRAFRAVGGSPRYIASASGACMRDADGNEFVDYVCSWGAIILGHADPEVTEAIHQAALKGASYGAPHEGEILLAEEVQAAMPGMEMLRFVNSGTEATMSAIRVARGATGRPKVIKFDGCYHGHADGLLAKAGSGVATFSLPDSAGVPSAFAEQTLIAPYNNLEAVKALFEANAGQVACVIVEPVAGNMGVVPPAEGFLAGLREITRQEGALLILDEVMTGFRVAHGGATARFNADPDLICTGKVIGGGLPVGAYGGRKEIMSLVAPVGPVYQAGTLSGNPLAMAAGLAVLRRLNADLYARQEALGKVLDAGLLDAVTRAGVPAQIHRVGSMLTVFFTDQPVVDMDSAGTTDRALYGKVFHGMLERGFYLPPSALEAWFFSAAHTEQQVQATVSAFADSLSEAVA